MEFDLQGPVALTLNHMYRHLQHVTLPWRPWDGPAYYDQVVDQLVTAGAALDVIVDPVKCTDQSYLNFLHNIFEKNYNGNPGWLDYHERIHLIEKRALGRMTLGHRELAGPIQQPFNLAWMDHGITQLDTGTVFVEWAELGKTPYKYWNDGEPDDPVRLRELAKPWITLRGRIVVALQPLDLMQNLDTENFDRWWKTREKDWCNHWSINSWSLVHQRSVVPVGNLGLDQVNLVLQWLDSGYHPTHVRL